MGNQPGKSAQHYTQSGKPKKNVTWKSAEAPLQPGRPMLLALHDQPPDVITLKWEKPESDGGAQVTGYVIEHRRMGSPHWVRSLPQLIPTTEVSISGLEPGWRYQFRVCAENIVGKSLPSELSDALTVTLQRNAISVPRFVNELAEEIYVVENERVELRIGVVGTPPPEINWFKDGFEIFSSRRTKIISDNENSVLIFHQVALTDDGEIKCSATNRAGHVATKCKLIVEAPPKIRLPRNYEEGLIVEADEVLRLKVGVAGQPTPQIQWFHEGQPITSTDDRFEMAMSEKNSAVKINNVKRKDRGEYVVKASNKLGDDITSFLVTVTSKPEAPGKVKLKMSVGRSATITWTPPADDGGCKIGMYIVEYFRMGWNVWLKASTTRQLTATLNDLIEGSEYKFRVKAENPYGVSEPSPESDALFIPDPKKITITNELDELKPVPPRRKALSPPRSVETRGTSPLHLKPQLKHFDNEDLHLEMSYGTPNTMLETSKLQSNTVVRRSSSPMIPAAKPKKTLVDEGTTTEMDPPVPEEIPAPEEPPIESRRGSIDDQGSSIASNISLALRRSQEPVDPKGLELPSENEIISQQLTVENLLKVESSNEERHSEVQTSNEFLLVFHSNNPEANLPKNDSFELDLEEAIASPRISISTPDLLTVHSTLLEAFPLRRSVSSTELLYEKAMAKFYEAVELEEAVRSRKSSIAPKSNSVEPQTTVHKKRLGSMTEAERLSFEKRSNMRRSSADAAPSPAKERSYPKANGRSNFFDSNRSDIDTSASQVAYAIAMKDKEDLERATEEFLANEKGGFSSDYSASTDASEDESMERFKNEVRSRSVGTVGTRRTQSSGQEGGELETYHPRDMSAGIFTPYRSPTPDSSAVVLNKPVPLPDPAFIPKPILKKVASENPGPSEKNNGETENNPPERMSRPTGANPKKEKSKGGIKSFFKKKDKAEKEAAKLQEQKKAAEAAELEVKRKAKEEEDRLKKQQEKISQEEAKVVVDHYSDLVREVAATKKYHTPLYLDKEELKKATEKAGETFVDDVEEQPMKPQLSPRLSLSERKQMQFVQNSASKMAVTVNNHLAVKAEDDSEQITVTEESRGRSKVIKVKRIIKKRVPSRSRSRADANREVAPNNVAAEMASHMKSVEAKATENQELEEATAHPRTTDELLEEAQNTLKAAFNYMVDLCLFLFACYVYIFKDARLVIPILALIIYRQIGDAVRNMIPNWVKRLFSS